MNQTVQFAKPVFIDSRVLARVEVASVQSRGRGLQCQCTTLCTVIDPNLESAQLVVHGSALVYVPQPLESAAI